jgi:PAS domain S-box-containing protein
MAMPSDRALLASIVESSDDAIISKDLNGIITSWNRAAGRIFGYAPEEIIGTPVLRLIPPELHEEEVLIMQRLRAGERMEHFETVRMRKDGKTFAVSLTLSPIVNADGVVIGSSKIVREISDRKEMERLLLDTEKIVAAGRMAATIAHEINNPLEAVVNLIYLARLSPSVNEQVRDYLKLAEQEIERVGLIARQTLGFFRETDATVKLPVSELLDEVLTVYRTKLAHSRIDVERDYVPSPPLTMHRGELTQVFANLVSNAIDAMPDGGGLKVSVAPEGVPPEDGVRVKMRDHGTGISNELLEKIFEPFFTTKQYRGTGIGLWISRQLIEDHMGSIDVTSRTSPPEQGTCFSIFLPYLNGLQADGSASAAGRRAV